MDSKKILELAKKRGLDVGEEALQSLGQLTIDIIELFAEQNKIAKVIFVSVEDEMRKELYNLIDKVDGEVDAK